MVEQIANKVRAGQRVTGDEALELYREAPTSLLGRLADGIRPQT
jgi:2-iminoacetate synthase ThiH